MESDEIKVIISKILIGLFEYQYYSNDTEM